MRFSKVSLIAAAVSTVITIGGCVSMDTENREPQFNIIQQKNQQIKEQLKNKMMEHMNQKYDDTFFFNSSGEFHGRAYLEIFVTAQEYPGELIYVDYWGHEDSEEIFDGYIYTKYKKQAEDLVKSSLTEILGCEFFYENTMSAYDNGMETFDADMTFEEYVQAEKTLLEFVAIVSKDYQLDKTTFSEQLKDVFLKNNARISTRIFFADETEDFSRLLGGKMGFHEYMDRHKNILNLDFSIGNSVVSGGSTWGYNRW